ncbi:MAG: HNH endonuclease, partial [Streptosporangiaceae bacterium]
QPTVGIRPPHDAPPAHGGGSTPGGDDDPGRPPLTDADMPQDDGYHDVAPPLPDGYVDWDPGCGDPIDDHFTRPDVIFPWPPLPPAVPAPSPTAPPSSGAPRSDTGPPGHTTPPGDTAGRPPPGGLLDLTLSWATLTGQADAPATLGRIGPVTAQQARQLAALAIRHHDTTWRVIITGTDHRAITVARIPGVHPPPGYEPPGLTATIGRVTVILPADLADLAGPAERARPADPAQRYGPGDPADRGAIARLHDSGMHADILDAARRALARAQQRARADHNAPGGCAHTLATPAYRPPPRTREHVIARDQTCRNPRCGQPAWRADLDHTIPYDKGGLTCPCDLGPLCRRHHQLKQHPGWTLTQPRPGYFQWTTPAGRTYITLPDPYHAG